MKSLECGIFTFKYSWQHVFLGNIHIYSLVKPLYWSKRKQPFKDVSLNWCSSKVSKILEKHMWKNSCFNKGSQGAIIFLGLKITATFWRKINNDIKAETNKTPTTDSALTRKSRFQYIKIWIYSRYEKTYYGGLKI